MLYKFKSQACADVISAENPRKDVEADGDSVMLRHRAAPFIELLKCSAEAGKDVVWGV